jgi:nitrate reductase cytochrome c-type subunit
MKYNVLILILIGFFSCKKSNEPSYVKKNLNQEIHPGKKLMETRCYVCHSPAGSHDDRIAPPMIAVKKHYISEGTTKEAFIASMQNWIKNPTEENAKMRGAVRKFGVMPKQYFSEKNIKEISDYLFDNDIEEPEWFQEHYNEERGKGMNKGNGQGKGQGKGNGKMKGQMMKETNVNDKDLRYSERGLKYALATKAVLGKNLMGKTQKEGTLAALTFCNTKAYPLTDSMAVVHKASIKRVSDKPRNLNNKANKEELGYIQIFKNNIKNNKKSQPIVVESLKKVNVYYPIKTNEMCLQCHGLPNKQISDNTFLAIQKLYPNDKAVGYDMNQVRGIWNVSFTK